MKSNELKNLRRNLARLSKNCKRITEDPTFNQEMKGKIIRSTIIGKNAVMIEGLRILNIEETTDLRKYCEKLNFY